MLKKWLIVISLVVVAIGLFSGYFTGAKLDEESSVYADRVIPAIVRRFDSSNFLQFASSEIKKRYSVDEIDTMMNDYRAFGDFVEFSGVTGKATRSVKFWDSTEHSITAKYQALVEFEKATTVVEVRLIKSIRGWSILEFKLFPVDAESLNQAIQQEAEAEANASTFDLNSLVWASTFDVFKDTSYCQGNG